MLIVGKNKFPILKLLPNSYLFIDDGTMIDEIELPPRRKVITFDHSAHTFNPLKRKDYLSRDTFISGVMSAFRAGQGTLTKEGVPDVFFEALKDNPSTLTDLFTEASKDPSYLNAQHMIRRILHSPVLNRVLSKDLNFSLKGIVLVRLNRAELGDFDAFLLGQLLIGLYQGTVVIPDYGFYASQHHANLVHQNRIIAGVNFLDELPDSLKNSFLLQQVIPSHCTYEDARTLALNAGHKPDPLKQENPYNKFIDDAML